MVTLADVARLVDGTVHGNDAVAVTGLATLDDAGPDELAFIGAERYLTSAPASGAAAFLVHRGVHLDGDGRPRIEVDDVDLASIRVLTLFAPEPSRPQPGVHPTAWVHSSVELGAEVRIGANATIDARCRLGDGVTIHPGVHLYGDVTIGDGSEIHSGTVIRERCEIGRGVIMHPNVTIGADGFGFRPAPDGRGVIKVPQISHVIIGDGVEIGAGSCVDRGKTSPTLVGDGTKIDNLVQIAHNCRIGRCCIIAGACAIGGSVTLGDGVVLAGRVGIADHLTVEAGVTVGAGSGVVENLPNSHRTYLGTPAAPSGDVLRQWVAIRKLPQLIRDRSRRKMADSPGRPRDPESPSA